MMIGGNALLHPLPPPIGANPNIPGVVYGSLPLGYHPIVMGQQQHPLLDPRLRVPIGGLGAPHDAPSFLQYSSSALGLPYTNIATVPEGERLLAMGELLERERQLSRGLLLETRMTLPSHFLPSVHHGELLGTAMASTAATGTGLGNLALSSTASRTGFPASTVSESDKANGTSGSTGTRVSTASAATILERLPMPPNRARVRIPHFSERAYVPLAIDEDQNWLSELLCFVRSEVVEVFRANVDDLRSRNSSKKICLGQVGIRCRFCAHLPVGSRAGRSSSFPSSLDRIYQSLTMMLRDHFGNCNAMPSPTKEKFLRLKRKTTQGATDSKLFWVYAAEQLGLINTKDGGIWVCEQTDSSSKGKKDGDSKEDTFDKEQENAEVSSVRSNRSDPPVTPSNGEEKLATCQVNQGAGTSRSTPIDGAKQARLLYPEDREIIPPFLYALLEQVTLVNLEKTEQVGNRKSLPVGLPGLACRHCNRYGRKGLCRVFPARRRTLSAKLCDLYEHLKKCNLCPNEVRHELARLKSLDASQDGKMSREERGFLEELWTRMGSPEA